MQPIERDLQHFLEQPQKVDEFLDSIDMKLLEEEYLSDFIQISKTENFELDSEESLKLATKIVRKILTFITLGDRDDQLLELDGRSPTSVEVLQVLNIINTRDFTEDEVLKYLYVNRFFYTNGGPEIPEGSLMDPKDQEIVDGINILLDRINPSASMVMVKTDMVEIKYPYEFLGELGQK